MITKKACLSFIYLSVILQQVVIFYYINHLSGLDDYYQNQSTITATQNHHCRDPKPVKKLPVITKERVAIIVTGQLGRVMELDTKMRYMVKPLLRMGYEVDMIFSLNIAEVKFGNNRNGMIGGKFSSFQNISDVLDDGYQLKDFRYFFHEHVQPRKFMKNPTILKKYDKQEEGSTFIKNRFKADMQQLFSLKSAYDYLVNEVELKNSFRYDYVIRIREDVSMFGKLNFQLFLDSHIQNNTDYATLSCNKHLGINDKACVMTREAAHYYMGSSFESMYVNYPRRKRIRNTETFYKHVLRIHKMEGMLLDFDDFPIMVVRSFNETGMCYHSSTKCPNNYSMYYNMFLDNWCGLM
eukprot:TRINITY_DN12525_c0_g1_i1.p1 TRINITY_DN12525_c0_g1~~TRINITY_DN12525_c0_g1_i1.p1  ORF type:complete len:352 (-),score=34.11 TRINITY_DN12525_c0_g1_i1:105-1160(-)